MPISTRTLFAETHAGLCSCYFALRIDDTHPGQLPIRVAQPIIHQPPTTSASACPGSPPSATVS